MKEESDNEANGSQTWQCPFEKLSPDEVSQVLAAVRESQEADKLAREAKRAAFVDEVLEFCRSQAVPHGSEPSDSEHELAMWAAIRERFADAWQPVLLDYCATVRTMFAEE